MISIFLIVLGNSRYKYIELTFDQTQSKLFRCLINAFKYFGGSTKEILFDNMKTIVDHAKSIYTNEYKYIISKLPIINKFVIKNKKE